MPVLNIDRNTALQQSRAALAVIVTCGFVCFSLAPLCFAADATTAANDKIEACVETLREAPSEAVPSGLAAFLYQDDYKHFQIGGEEQSKAFSGCLANATKAGFDSILFAYSSDAFGSRAGDRELIVQAGDQGFRYIYVDAYQRKYLIDLKEKASYDLLRIPPSGSIEALGTWTGSVTSSGGCKNSYGDPCGSTYSRAGNGGYTLNK